MKTRRRDLITKLNARKAIRELLDIGNYLSNIAYNAKQRIDVPQDLRRNCETYQKKWDEVRNALPEYLKRD